MSDSVIIRRCASIPEALVCVGLLKARGLLAEIDNAAHAELDWGIIPALGGVAIRVPTSQFHAAKREIIQSIEHAEDSLSIAFEPAGDMNVDTGRRRWRAWTMLLIYSGIVHVVFGYILAQILKRLPDEWFPEPMDTGLYFGIPIQTQVAPPALAWDGIILMIAIGLFLLWEVISVTRTHPNEDV